MNKKLEFFSGIRWHNLLRAISLLLLIVAIFGPWGYTADGVPPPEWCGEPFFLQTSPENQTQRCVRFLPGIEILSFWGGGMIDLPMQLLSGSRSLAEMGREMLIIPLGLLIVLPFASTVSVLASRESRGARIFNAVTWGLALIPAMMIVLFDPLADAWRLWGILLYSGLAAATLLFELAAARKRRANPI